jgi:hypothetical protein
VYAAENWTLRKVDQKYLESFEMCCWRRMEKISSTNCVKNEEVLSRVKVNRDILHRVKLWKAHLRRNCLLKYVTEGKIEGRI